MIISIKGGSLTVSHYWEDILCSTSLWQPKMIFKCLLSILNNKSLQLLPSENLPACSSVMITYAVDGWGLGLGDQCQFKGWHCQALLNGILMEQGPLDGGTHWPLPQCATWTTSPSGKQKQWKDWAETWNDWENQEVRFRFLPHGRTRVQLRSSGSTKKGPLAACGLLWLWEFTLTVLREFLWMIIAQAETCWTPLRARPSANGLP